MAAVFLSYDRDDTSKARLIAVALERAGHEVWWDLHVRGGAQFSLVIEEALKAAEAVIVLWSRSSVKSAWVRDEAAAGRDSGRLIPVSLGEIEPPMGFRQFQTVDFSRWKGRSNSTELRQLLSAINELRPASPDREKNASSAILQKSKRGYFRIAAGGTVVLAIAGLSGLWWFKHHSPAVPTVAVVAADTSSNSRALARDLYVKLGRLRAGDADTIEIVDATVKKGLDFTFQVSGASSNGNPTANITLIDQNHVLLWSKDFERAQNQYGDLKQELALTSARVLGCATNAASNSGSTLDQRTLRLYLNGCSTLSEAAWTDFRSLVPVFREVTRSAPRFEGGWAKLVETEAYVINWESLSKTAPERDELALDVARARKVNPRMAEAYFGESTLLVDNDLASSSALIDRALRDNPDSSLIQGMNATFLSQVGRVKEAVEATKRAYELDPLSADTASGYIVALAYAGQLDAAREELKKAESFWPEAHPLVEARFRINLRYGDPQDALRVVRSGLNPGYAHFDSFLLARINPTQENIDHAVADAKAAVGQSGRGAGWLFLALAQFGREDEIYRILEDHPDMVLATKEMFFRSIFGRFRHDLRFMKLAKKQGLIEYWRSSGHWPDFCHDRDLPYDCKEVAASLAGDRT
ncbi:toll/interleukin-1 receptor domain-containing protein [Sphingomonas alba]|uniref:TIR domain-containing protein n=1 Tax=Sphingomonas alba TaxID=2908208 RepID=A0ABT0RK98_9SPHN|nr:toll/interleukin-1 receptor domain-containing protein [Sphingomonas alba]MCL6683067.1 TIR domain-containing protein [Sphingomonas alba]